MRGKNGQPRYAAANYRQRVFRVNNMDLVLFDLDDTLLVGDSSRMWGEFLVEEGILDGTFFRHKCRQFHQQYMAGTLDIHEFQRFFLQPLVDYPLKRMYALRQCFVEKRIRSAVANHAPSLVNTFLERGDCVVVITAANRFITAPIVELLGIKHLIAVEPEVISGHYTGDITDVPCFREGKIERMRMWRDTQRQRFDRTHFYSDSHNDLPLLHFVDEPVAVDPDPQLANVAKTSGWSIISLRGARCPDF